MRRAGACAIALCWLALAGCLQAQESEGDILRRAMQDELDRSLSELQLEGEPKPYFISYTVTELESHSMRYVLGSHDSSSTNLRRTLFVAVRVGNSELDNTGFLDVSNDQIAINLGIIGTALPLRDNYDELRRVMWLATDAAYKAATKTYSAKRSALENQIVGSRTPDFSEEEPHLYLEESDQLGFSLEELAGIAREVSQAFADQPNVFASSAHVQSTVSSRTYLDTEGNHNRLYTPQCTVGATARTQALDGAAIHDSTYTYSRSCSDLPAIDSLRAKAVAMAQRLEARRDAEPLYVYSGPVLFEPDAAAHFLNQVLAKLLGATSVPETGNPQWDSNLEQVANPFVAKIDARVFPRTISVFNDPTISDYQGRPLLGSYAVDAEGMPTRRTELISNGILKTLLTTRDPVNKLVNSTGSHRGYGNPLPGNLFIQPESGLSMDELRTELIELAKENGSEFALLVRKMQSMEDFDGSESPLDELFQTQFAGGISAMPAIDVVKIYTDGREVQVLPLVVTDFVDSHFRDIVATSAETVHADVAISPFANMNILSLFTEGISALHGGKEFISIITPALLFEDLSLRSAVGFKPNLPAVPHPLAQD
ncbi:MAG: metallopeptidase TldD-related protein [Gammaproteobacteria bacterium]|nr:metallopeptidase TldD-related protein [Gammaproteobacteria bacterium]